MVEGESTGPSNCCEGGSGPGSDWAWIGRSASSTIGGVGSTDLEIVVSAVSFDGVVDDVVTGGR